MPRVFVAIGLPRPLPDGLEALRVGLPGAGWVAVDNLHLTVRFVGVVDEAALTEIDATLETLVAPPFVVTPTVVDVFVHDRAAGHGHMANTLWLGVETQPALVELATRIDALLQAQGVVAARGRDFLPHITLARLKRVREQDLDAYLVPARRVRVASFSVDRFTLYRSDQNVDGVHYVPLRDYPLTGGAD